MNPLPSVVVTVLNYNRFKDTIECLSSLKMCAYPEMTILVVDNGSTDSSARYIGVAHPDIEIVATGKNEGYTGGVNCCIREALSKKPKYILVLNNDTLVDPNFLFHLVNALEEHPHGAAAIGTILAEHDRRTIWYAGGRMISWRGLAIHEHKGKNVQLVDLGQTRKVTFVSGCMILFRTSILEFTGLEDERFFMYLDDIELSCRIQRKGFDLIYVPQSVIYHKVLLERESAFKLYYSVRNRLLFITSCLSGLVCTIAVTYFILVIAVKSLFWKLTNPLLYKAAKFGLQDFFSRRYYEGRGFSEFGF